MGRAAAESILHGLVAAAAIMLILRTGRIGHPATRLRFWLLALAGPVLFTPLLWWCFPDRTAEYFRDHWSLLSGSHFVIVSWHGLRVGAAVALGLATAGSLLYLRDLVPFALDIARSRGRGHDLAAFPEALSSSVARAAAHLGMETPAIVVRKSPHPILICRGLRRPVIVASTGMLDLLAPDEILAAIAHEMCHARWRDPLFGWVLMLARGIFFFNPAVQLCARAAVHEIERRADRGAASLVADPELVARSLRKMAGGGRKQALPPHGATWHGLRLAAIEDRCQALLDAGEATPGPRWALPATAVGLGVILTLTVV